MTRRDRAAAGQACSPLGVLRGQSKHATALHRRTAPRGRVPALGQGSVSDEEEEGARLDLDLPPPRAAPGAGNPEGREPGSGFSPDTEPAGTLILNFQPLEL